MSNKELLAILWTWHEILVARIKKMRDNWDRKLDHARDGWYRVAEVRQEVFGELIKKKEYVYAKIKEVEASLRKQEERERLRNNVRDRGYDLGRYPQPDSAQPRKAWRHRVGSSTLRNRRGVEILRLDGEGRLIISKRAKRMLGGRRGAGCYSREEMWRNRPDRVAERELREELERYFFRREDALLQYEHFFEIPSEWHEMLGVETAMQIVRSRCSLHRLCESEE